MGYTTASGLWNEAVADERIEARVDGDLNLVVYPRKRPINSVSSLKIVRGTYNLDLSLTDDDGNTRYIIPTPSNALVYPSYQMNTSVNTILLRFAQIKYVRFFTEMDYIAGYTTIPEDIVVATTLLASDIFMTHANKEGLVSITQGKIQKRWRQLTDGRSDFVIRAYDILNHYRIASGWLG